MHNTTKQFHVSKHSLSSRLVVGTTTLLGGILVVSAILGFNHTTIFGRYIPDALNTVAVGGLVIELLLGGFSLAMAVSLWARKRWAFWTMTVIVVLTLLENALAFTHPQRDTTIPTFVLNIVVALIVLVCLLVYRFDQSTLQR